MRVANLHHFTAISLTLPHFHLIGEHETMLGSNGPMIGDGDWEVITTFLFFLFSLGWR